MYSLLLLVNKTSDNFKFCLISDSLDGTIFIYDILSAGLITMEIVNVVGTAQLNCEIDLVDFVGKMSNIIYNRRQFSGAVWKSRVIHATCLIFGTGKLVITGAKSEIHCKQAARQYGRIVQKLGYAVKISHFKTQTITAVKRTGRRICLKLLSQLLGSQGNYHPEIFPGLVYTVDATRIKCIVHNGGTIILSGANSLHAINEVYGDILLNVLMCAIDK